MDFETFKKDVIDILDEKPFDILKLESKIDFFKPKHTPEFVTEIMELAAETCKCNVEAMKGKTRKSEVVKARWLFWDYMKNNYKYSIVHIGKMLNKPHDVVHYAMRQLKIDIASHPPTTNLYIEFTRKIEAWKATSSNQ